MNAQTMSDVSGADPIAALRAGCASIERATDGVRPNLIEIYPEIPRRMQARYERLRRKPLLSGRYEKLQRQRAQGVAGQRVARLAWARELAETFNPQMKESR